MEYWNIDRKIRKSIEEWVAWSITGNYCKNNIAGEGNEWTQEKKLRSVTQKIGPSPRKTIFQEKKLRSVTQKIGPTPRKTISQEKRLIGEYRL